MASNKRKERCKRLMARNATARQREALVDEEIKRRKCHKDESGYGCRALYNERWALRRKSEEARNALFEMNCGEMRPGRNYESTIWKRYHALDRRGLGDGCRDARGFVPVPACRGHHVPRGKKSCPHGVSKTTGKCLKHPRRK